MMAKKIRRILAMIMVLCVFAGAMPLQALAADGTVTEPSTEISPEGLTTDVVTTTTTTTDAQGNTTVTVTIEKTTTGTTADGVDLNRTETSVDSTTTDAAGNVTGASFNENGTESKDWTEELPETAKNLPEVKVDVKPGETGEGATSADVTVLEGDKASGNYTETTTTIDRKVSASVSEEKIIVSEHSYSDMEGKASVDYEGKEGIRYGKKGTDTEMQKGAYWDSNDLSKEQPDDPGFEFQYTGIDEIALDPYRTNVWTVTYKKDENTGEFLRDENGDLIIESKIAVSPSGGHSTSWDFVGYPTQTKMFVLTKYGENNEKERFFTYCIDNDTMAQDGAWYSISNLEDSDYYPDEESENHLRAIVNNGYWGTEEGTGSIPNIQENMRKDFGEDETITVTDLNGKEWTYNIHELIDGLIEGEALNVTQAAIWSYSNGAMDVQTGKNSILVNDNFYYALSNNKNDPARGSEALARMRVMYNWMLGLTQEKTDEDSTVINEKNFVEEVSLTVGDKIGEVTVLSEDSSVPPVTNGIYETDLNFTLAFVPTGADDLLVCLKYTDMDGNEQMVTKRLAGEKAEGETFDRLTQNGDGSYTFENLKLSENQNFNFDLNLKGTQYLSEGVYIYTAHGGVSESQTMVGIAEGSHSVDVTASMTLNFSVDEEKTVHVERQWNNNGDPDIAPYEAPPGDEEPVPQVFHLENEEDVETIPEEEVPLAAAPVTGDLSNLWITLILAAAFGLFILNITGKKRGNAAF